MVNCSKKAIALLFVMLFLFLPSCMYWKKVKMDTINQTQKYLITGDYQKTIDVYIAIHNKYPKDQTLLGHYITTIEDIKITADRAFEEEDFASAGRIYHVLLSNYSHFKGFVQLLSFDRKSLNAVIKNSEIRLIKRQVDQHIAGGDLQKALDSYRAMCARYSKDKTLLRSYVKTIQDIRNMADRAFEEEDFALAGRFYHVLLSNYSHFKGFVQLLSFDRESLNARIADCSKFLTKKGLEQYRKGDLANAISTWKYILVFDPSNVEIKRAINTASIQLKNL